MERPKGSDDDPEMQEAARIHDEMIGTEHSLFSCPRCELKVYDALVPELIDQAVAKGKVLKEASDYE